MMNNGHLWPDGPFIMSSISPVITAHNWFQVTRFAPISCPIVRTVLGPLISHCLLDREFLNFLISMQFSPSVDFGRECQWIGSCNLRPNQLHNQSKCSFYNRQGRLSSSRPPRAGPLCDDDKKDRDKSVCSPAMKACGLLPFLWDFSAKKTATKIAQWKKLF